MPTYVSQSACAGVRPPHLVSLSLLSRPAHVSRLLRERRVPRFIVAPAGSGKTSLALDYAETVFYLVSLSLLSRPAHVSRLLRERRVPRFIVAPAGSGKTSLALDYAETVFSLRNVFWLDGKSPCFLRDLDNGTIARKVGSISEKPFLLVVDDVPVLDSDRAVFWLDGKSPCFLRDLDNGTIARKVGSISEKPFLLVVDDVPVLDSDRAERFEAAIDAVIDAGGEMVVACAPDADVFARQTDRVLLDASDLLLSDDEFDALAPAAQMALAQMPRGSRRVAGFAWGAPSQAVLRLELLAAEVSDPRERLSVLAMTLANGCRCWPCSFWVREASTNGATSLSTESLWPPACANAILFWASKRIWEASSLRRSRPPRCIGPSGRTSPSWPSAARGRASTGWRSAWPTA